MSKTALTAITAPDAESAPAACTNPRRLRRPAAAAYLNVSESFLEKAAVRGDGPPYYRLSARLVVYERDELDGWAASCRVCNSAQAAGPRKYAP